ncbi:uncharacterized protein B0T15DRAFT_513342 [Chaetomium strumarium]|uniref:Uncharacterized protein n=1 Tax=Chaetomium strumarium TaxID=1170767 RepID=A0AAJ0GNC2_9PEZI|nr:hypothetical protein B0T15DRAFT_513342 [Chaetomium strumarium]
MATKAALCLIRALRRAVKQQQQVVEQQEESVKFLVEANAFLDVEQLTGSTIQKEAEKLQTSQDILNDLDAQLRWAIDSWKDMVSAEDGGEHPLWTPSPSAPMPQPPLEEQRLPAVSENSRDLSLSDPAVGALALYTQKWDNWLQAPTIPGLRTLESSLTAPWWVQKQDHYGLCHPQEQGQIESAARVAQMNRGYYAEPHASPYQSGAQQLRGTWYQRYNPAALPLTTVSECGLTHFRPARANSTEFWLDKEFDPFFWQKNLRPGNIWTQLSRYPTPDEEDNVSPRALPIDM